MRAYTMMLVGGWLSGINILLVIVLMIIGLPRLGESLFALVVVACAMQLVAVVLLILGFVKDHKLPAPESQEQPRDTSPLRKLRGSLYVALA